MESTGIPNILLLIDLSQRTLSPVSAGVEGTISQAVRGFGLRRSRYVGQAKTHLKHDEHGQDHGMAWRRLPSNHKTLEIPCTHGQSRLKRINQRYRSCG